MSQISTNSFKITNPEKLLWPEEGITKADFLEYFAKISPYILPHIQNRPMVFTRYPNGIHEKAFYQKNAPDYAPSWLKTYKIRSEHKIINYILINDAKSLLWAANQASIELHPWLSKINSLDFPDFVVFDFDPMEDTDFEDARTLSLALKNLLDIYDLKGFPKTSGATGLQVYVPIVPRYTYEDGRTFAKFFCTVLEKTFPQIATLQRSVEKREGKLYLDYLQNAKGKTIIAPYSPRPRKGAPVSCPITWEELEGGVTPNMFTIKNIPDRLQEKGDIFKKTLEIKQNINKFL